MTGYRQYAINHEVGHALGNQHVGCGGNGQPAPVMMQQSFGVDDDYVSMLNDIPGGDKGKVAKDGRICEPNAWPNPRARRASQNGQGGLRPPDLDAFPREELRLACARCA